MKKQHSKPLRMVLRQTHFLFAFVIYRHETVFESTHEDMTMMANHINSATRPGLEYKSPYRYV